MSIFSSSFLSSRNKVMDTCTFNEEEFNKWRDTLDSLSFEDRALKIKDHMLKTGNIEQKSAAFFSAAFDYFMDHYKKGKPIDLEIMFKHLTVTEGFPKYNIYDFSRILIMLSFCGFVVSRDK